MPDPRRQPFRFSRRTDWDLATNALSDAQHSRKFAGKPILDLTESNPTRALVVDHTELVQHLADPAGAQYNPEARGLESARRAVSEYYRVRGRRVDAERITMTASTSEAYSWLFKLLTNAGDRVLIPRPSYPLFQYLASLEDVELVGYPLVPEENFRPDLTAIERGLSAGARAVILVHPNNPTGTGIREDDAQAISTMAREAGAAVIVDEVFADYLKRPIPPRLRGSFVDDAQALTFVLNGLSKVLAAPQLKLGWVVVGGPEKAVGAALTRLEIIADTYLSVSTYVQLALPKLFEACEPVQAAIHKRLSDNETSLEAMVAAASDVGVRTLARDGGWYAVLEVPRTQSELSWALSALDRLGVLVHPGHFYDMDREAYLIVSLLTRPAVFAEGVSRLGEHLRRL